VAHGLTPEMVTAMTKTVFVPVICAMMGLFLARPAAPQC
jgi:hypothetical protein